MTRHYKINEVFASVQGEGHRAGQPSVFVRFSGCNLRCSMSPGPLSPGGFDCDTEFVSGRSLTADEVLAEVKRVANGCQWIVLTGGEPALQVDDEIVLALKFGGFNLAIETNGSKQVNAGIDWITVSPKVAEHCIRQVRANEVKYVRGYGQAIPRTVVVADHYFVSPAFNGLSIDVDALRWCQQLCQDNPPWRISVQSHKPNGLR